MYDELESSIKTALEFLDINAEVLKDTSWEFRSSVIRNCNGYCPLVYVASKKSDIDLGKEDWANSSQILKLSTQVGFELARAADYWDGNINIRNKLLEILNPIQNPKYGVYNE